MLWNGPIRRKLTRNGSYWLFIYLYTRLLQTRRADITVAGFQSTSQRYYIRNLYSIFTLAWLFILSTVAIFCQSIPHIISTLFMHVLALVWSSSQIAATLQFRSDYGRLITGTSGACDGVDLLVGYFKNRLSYEIAMTVINVVTLAVSAYLSWRLFLVSDAPVRFYNGSFVATDLWMDQFQGLQQLSYHPKGLYLCFRVVNNCSGTSIESLKIDIHNLYVFN